MGRISHEHAHALKHTQLTVARLLAIRIGQEALLNQEPEYIHEVLLRWYIAEVVPLSIFEEERIHRLALALWRQLATQALDKCGGGSMAARTALCHVCAKWTSCDEMKYPNL